MKGRGYCKTINVRRAAEEGIAKLRHRVKEIMFTGENDDDGSGNGLGYQVKETGKCKSTN